MAKAEIVLGELSGGDNFTYVEELIQNNTTKTYNVTKNGVFAMDFNGVGGYIVIKDGELVRKVDLQGGTYGTFSYSNGVVTAGAGNYGALTVYGFYY